MHELLLLTGSAEPTYNIKAAAQRTGISAATLRAWERRYQVARPTRTRGNYRLYSERDIATLLWLKDQVDAGVSISRAAALLEQIRRREAEMAARPDDVDAVAADGGQRDTWGRLNERLHDCLARMDERCAASALAEATALFSVESTCVNLIAPVLERIGAGWHAGSVSIASEHFATHFLLGRLLSWFNALEQGIGPLALVGCGPGERHEVGSVMLALLLRRRGFNVRYLGADMPHDAWLRAITEMAPRVVAISATLPGPAAEARALADRLERERFPVAVVLGGQAFGDGQAQRDSSTPPSIMDGVQRIANLLRRANTPG